VATAVQGLAGLGAGSFLSLVSTLLKTDQSQVTEVQPLNRGGVAAVAVMLTVEESQFDGLDQQLRTEMENDPQAGRADYVLAPASGHDRIDPLVLPIQRYISGVEDELASPARDRSVDEIDSSQVENEPPSSSIPVGLPANLQAQDMVRNDPVPPATAGEPRQEAAGVSSEAPDPATLAITAALSHDVAVLDQGSAVGDLSPFVVLTSCIAAGAIAAHIRKTSRARRAFRAIPGGLGALVPAG
jgi:hypothetical protein